MSNDPYWAACERTVNAVEKAAPTTAAEVVSILKKHDPQKDGVSGDAFWSAYNMGTGLDDLLDDAGWVYDWSVADYHWQMRHPDTGDVITYTEGDVNANNPTRPL